LKRFSIDRPIRGRGGSRGAAKQIWGAGPVIFDILPVGNHGKSTRHEEIVEEDIGNFLGCNGQMAQALSRESTNYQVLHFPWPIVSAIGSNNTIRHDPIDVSK
jgi:hypothetical protein